MSSELNSVDVLLFAAMTPSALARAEDAYIADAGAGDDADANASAARALAEGRGAIEVLARALEPIPFEKASPQPASHTEALRHRVVASLSSRAQNVPWARYGIFADRIARLFDISIDAAHALFAKLDDRPLFHPGPNPGVTYLDVEAGPKCRNAMTVIGRFVPGAHFPHHSHVGEEITFLLDGGYRDTGGEELWRGDETVMGGGSEHELVVLSGVDCIAAVVAYGGVKIPGFNA